MQEIHESADLGRQVSAVRINGIDAAAIRHELLQDGDEFAAFGLRLGDEIGFQTATNWAFARKL